MKIGIVTHYMPPHIGGIEIVADSLFNAYRAAGFETRWVAAREPSTEAALEDGRIRVGCWNGLERRLGVPWPILGVKGMRELGRLVRWADLVHVHDCLYAATGAAVLLARRAHKPVILSQHIGFVNYRRALINVVEHLAIHTLARAVLRSASHVVFCTKAAERFAAPLLEGRTGGTSVIPSGIDTDRFKPPTQDGRRIARESLNLPQSARVALFVGRLVEKKGIDVLADLIRRMPSHLFLIVGDGPLRTMLPADAENVVWLPAIAPEAMAGFYQAADVFLLPSHGEGLPVSVQEAMATGLPVIVSANEEFTTSLEDERACLAPERTSAGFQESLETLAHDSELSASLAARSRELAVREWSLAVMSARYEALIRALTAKNRAND
jgi:glycosyltransferase involved in cell wall biosynthesis